MKGPVFNELSRQLKGSLRRRSLLGGDSRDIARQLHDAGLKSLRQPADELDCLGGNGLRGHPGHRLLVGLGPAWLR